MTSMTASVRASDTPYAVHAEQGLDCWWCACGQSKAQPLCDGLAQGCGGIGSRQVHSRSQLHGVLLRLQKLPSLWSGWQVTTWLAAPNAQLDGHSPADRLDSALDAVAHAAQSLESVDEFPVSLVRRARVVAAHV